MQNELYDVFYNGQFLCRIVDALLQQFLEMANKVLPFNGDQTVLLVRKVVPQQPEEEKNGKEPAKKA